MRNPPRPRLPLWLPQLLAIAVLVSATDGAAQGNKKLGVPLKVLKSYDSTYEGPKGIEFLRRIEDAAQKTGLNPGLLAENLITETTRGAYLRKGATDSFEIGTDDYYVKRKDILAKVPAASGVTYKCCHDSLNETGRTVKSVMFPSGEQAVLASAVYLKHGEEVLRAAALAAGEDFDTLSLEQRWALTRLAFNAGHGRAKKNMMETFAGGDVLILKGPTGPPWGPQRAATVHTARAIHLSVGKFFLAP